MGLDKYLVIHVPVGEGVLLVGWRSDVGPKSGVHCYIQLTLRFERVWVFGLPRGPDAIDVAGVQKEDRVIWRLHCEHGAAHPYVNPVVQSYFQPCSEDGVIGLIQGRLWYL